MVRNCFIVIAASMLFIFGDLVPTFIYATILIYCYRDNKKLEEFIDFLDGYEL